MKVGTDAMLLGAFVAVIDNQTVLDIGAGTGVLSLMVAQKAHNLKITSIEIDQNALVDLMFNTDNSPFDAVFKVVNADFTQYDFSEKFDLIISNPPFYKDSFLKGNNESRSVARNEENLSFELLMQKGANVLSDQGDFWMIFPSSEYEYIKQLAFANGLSIKKEISIFGKPNSLIRKIICFTKMSSETPKVEELTIRDLEGNYTAKYKKLTTDFHNKTL